MAQLGGLKPLVFEGSIPSTPTKECLFSKECLYSKMFKFGKISKTKRALQPAPSHEQEESLIGFSVRKVLDKNSIFCGTPSINAIFSYFEFVIDHLHFIPNKSDSQLLAIGKITALALTGIRSMNIRSTILNRANLEELDFGSSKQVIYDLINTISDPDEVFKPKRFTALMPPYYLYRYPIKNGHIIFTIQKESGNVHRVLISRNITKEDVLDFIWCNLENIIKLEADEELTYICSELAQKKIFGSSNNLIQKLKDDYDFFRKEKLSRGYL